MVFYHLSNKQSKQRNNQLVINGVGRQLSTLLFVKTMLFFCYLQGKYYLCLMAKAEIQIKGIEALKKRLMEKKQAVENVLDLLLAQLGEEAVTFSKDNKGYQDRTANLKNSISFAVFKDGKLLNSFIGNIPEPDKVKDGQAQVQKALEAYASNPGVVAPQGYTVIVVAGMLYGKYVEDKGYNVLYLTKHFLHNGIKDALKEALEALE